MKIFLKSLFFTLVVVFLSLLTVALIAALDARIDYQPFQDQFWVYVGLALILLGAAPRLWAGVEFYKHQIKVISVKPQQRLVVSGLYGYSRNPLYAGIILILFGSALIFGSVSGLILTLVAAGFFNYWVSVEERQLEQVFGEEYRGYKGRVRRWF